MASTTLARRSRMFVLSILVVFVSMLIMSAVFVATGVRGSTTTIWACIDRRNGALYNVTTNNPNLRCRTGETRPTGNFSRRRGQRATRAIRAPTVDDSTQEPGDGNHWSILALHGL
jgi:hypothetical protein